MTAQKFNEWRIFPRVALVFMGYLLYTFHMWFTQDNTVNVLDMSEWHIVGYASVVGVFVGLLKFYFETGNKGGTE